jgi:DNA-binding beta-propeller fold protein YncE
MSARRRLPLLAFAAVAALWIAACSNEESPVAPDVTPPEVESMTPEDGALGVPTEIVPVQVVFDEPVRVPDLSSSLVVRRAGVVLAGSVGLDSTATILTFVPSAPFAVATDYTVTLGAGIADGAGNARPDSVVTRFSTAFAFQRLGRLFIANQFSRNLAVLDLATDDPVPGSPVAISSGSPIRLEVDPGAEEVYVLYTTVPIANAGVLAVDGKTLQIRRDSGPILPADTVDLAFDPAHQVVFAVATVSNKLFVLDAQDLTPARAPYEFPRPDARPVQVEVASQLGYVLVALDGGSQLSALRLPALTAVPGFPAASAPRAHTILVDEPRARAWVGGINRYAVVDLINPARSQSFQMPACGCFRLFSMILDPVSDRVYFADRFDFVLAVKASNLEAAPESPGRVRFFAVNQDIVQDPRTGDLIIIGWRVIDTPMIRMLHTTLTSVGSTVQVVGDNALDAEVLP